MSKEPLFWYRPRSDGGYEGPLHSGQIEDVRKASGAWVPLFAGEAPVSAEQVGEVVLFGGDSDLKEVSWRRGKMPPPGTKLYTASAADLLDRVKKAISAQAHQVDSSPEMQGKRVDESPNLQSQQPAHGLPTERVLIDGTAYELPAAVAAELLRLHLEILGSEQAQSSGNPVQLDHLPDATKMVGQDQGDSWSGWACQYPGKLPRLYGAKDIAVANHHPEAGDRLIFLSAQQDADKVQADLLSSLVEIVDAVISSDEEGLIEHSETIIKARAAIDAAPKEPGQ